MTEITFGWPPRECSPNWRGHWARKAKAAKAYKAACWALAKEAGVAVKWGGPVLLRIEFVPPDRRGRDLDNMLASIKAALDGLALAIGINDKRFQLALSVRKDIGGMVKVRIEQP